MIRTHYLDWIKLSGQTPGYDHNLVVLDGAKMPWLPFDSGESWVAQCADYWTLGVYTRGPAEDDNLDGMEDVFVCNLLWAKYNDDERPDGQERRSMSVGDVIQFGKRLYLVRNAGFELVKWKCE
jgi:hypothetical protein